MADTKRSPSPISSFVVPTEDDIARFHALSESDRNTLIEQELQQGLNSGTSDLSPEDIWSEAVRRAQAKAREPNAL